MIALDSPRWRDLTCARGAPQDIPVALEQLASRPGDEQAWDRFLVSLYDHQGAHFSAMYAALPYLANAAMGADLGQLCDLVMAAVEIRADLPAELAPDLRASFDEGVARLRRDVELRLSAGAALRDDQAWALLTCKAALDGETPVLAQILSDLAVDEEGEARAACPICTAAFFVGRHAGDLVARSPLGEGERPVRLRSAAEPKATDSPPAHLLALSGLARRAGLTRVADEIAELAGTVACPRCREEISVWSALLLERS